LPVLLVQVTTGRDGRRRCSPVDRCMPDHASPSRCGTPLTAIAAALAKQYGLLVAAGHGLTYRNVGAVAGISEVSEFNIGHSIISRSIFLGLERAVTEMREAIRAGSSD